MRIYRWTVAAFVLVAAVSSAGHAQLGTLRKKAEEAAAKKAAAEAQKKSADSLKKASAKDAAKAGDQASPPVIVAAPTSSAPTQSGDPKVWENYDFVRGSRVIFYPDFTEDKVGNFARRLNTEVGPLR